MNGRARCKTLGTAAQDYTVPRLKAQGAGISRDIRTTLVNDSDDAEWNTHALNHKTVWTLPLGDDLTDRIVKPGNLFNSDRHGLDPPVVEHEPVEHRT